MHPLPIPGHAHHIGEMHPDAVHLLLVYASTVGAVLGMLVFALMLLDRLLRDK